MSTDAERTNRMPLEDLYQEVILDHNRRPRNFKVLEPCTASCHGYNPLCGDDYTVYLRLHPAAGGAVEEISFTGKGCAISKASGSMMTAKIKGRTPAEARAIKEAFLSLLTGAAAPDPAAAEALGSLNIFAGVTKYPIRVKCATLVWHALDEALSKAESTHPGGKP